MEHKFTRNIENVDDYRVVEIDVVSQIELETTWRTVVLLVVLAVLREVVESSLINYMLCSF
jgi:hypothetical protein